MTHESELKEYWRQKTKGNNVDYEPFDSKSGTLIIDNDRSEGITLLQLRFFEKRYGVIITKIRHYEFGFFLDINGKNESHIEFED